MTVYSDTKVQAPAYSWDIKWNPALVCGATGFHRFHVLKAWNRNGHIKYLYEVTSSQHWFYSLCLWSQTCSSGFQVCQCCGARIELVLVTVVMRRSVITKGQLVMGPVYRTKASSRAHTSIKVCDRKFGVTLCMYDLGCVNWQTRSIMVFNAVSFCHSPPTDRHVKVYKKQRAAYSWILGCRMKCDNLLTRCWPQTFFQSSEKYWDEGSEGDKTPTHLWTLLQNSEICFLHRGTLTFCNCVVLKTLCCGKDKK